MAKTYLEFKNQFLATQKKITQMLGVLESNSGAVQTQADLSVEAAKAIGVRVRALREDGMVGDEVDDIF
ncbi:MAG TPA: hypothetical protein VGN88_04810 [Phycisphaerae bacterium]|jgi:hypothetical protein